MEAGSSCIDNPRYPDVEAATFTVAADGTGDFTTIADALAALPAEGGTVFVKQGTYSITATITLPDKPVAIRGSGIGSTIIDIGSNAIAAFTMGFDQPYDFSDFSINGGSVAGQIGFSNTVDAEVTHRTRIRRVNVGALDTDQRIEKAFVNAHLSHVYEIEQGLCSVPTPGTAANQFVQGPGLFYLRNFSHVGPGGMSGDGVLYLIDCGTIDTTYGCSLSEMVAYNTSFQVGASGALTLSNKGTFFNCSFIPSGPPFADQYISAPLVIAFGCEFETGPANAISITGSGSIIHGCRTFCSVIESPLADNNRYIGNEGFDGSTIIGAGSMVNGARRKSLSGVATTNDYVQAFEHKNPCGVMGIGTIKNTGASNSLTVQETVTDLWGTTVAIETTVAPGDHYQLDPQVDLGYARPPYVSYKVEVKSTVADSPTTYDLRHTTQGAC